MTNGLGGYACGTVALANTRRYHGFLMASLTPPVQRTLLVAKFDLSVEYLGLKTDLTANEFAGGTVSPQGFVHLESFAVIEGIPTWRYAVADALLELQIFMAQGANTSYLRLELLRSTRAAAASRSNPMSRIATITANLTARSPLNCSRLRISAAFRLRRPPGPTAS